MQPEGPDELGALQRCGSSRGIEHRFVAAPCIASQFVSAHAALPIEIDSKPLQRRITDGSASKKVVDNAYPMDENNSHYYLIIFVAMHNPTHSLLRQVPPPHSPIPTLNSVALFNKGDEVLIVHGGETYRLRRTRQGKLILTK